MASSLSTLGSNLAERIHKRKSIMNIVKEKKPAKHVELNTKLVNVNIILNIQTLKMI